MDTARRVGHHWRYTLLIVSIFYTILPPDGPPCHCNPFLQSISHPSIHSQFVSWLSPQTFVSVTGGMQCTKFLRSELKPLSIILAHKVRWSSRATWVWLVSDRAVSEFPGGG